MYSFSSSCCAGERAHRSLKHAKVYSAARSVRHWQDHGTSGKSSLNVTRQCAFACDYVTVTFLCVFTQTIGSRVNVLQAVVQSHRAFMLKVSASSIQTAFPEDLEKGLRGVFDLAYELSHCHHCCICLGKRVSLIMYTSHIIVAAI